MVLEHKQIRIAFGLILAVVSLGCGLTEGLGLRSTRDATGLVSVPTRTPWPTFTPTSESVVDVPPEQNDESASGTSSDASTPIPVLPPTDTPAPSSSANTPEPAQPSSTDTTPATNTPAVAPPPTNTPAAPPPPTNTPAPPPPPTNTPAPPPPTKPLYQFTPAPWYAGERNDSIVRFYGYLKDVSDTPVNGYPVRATCGDYSVLSFPSGPSPVAPDWAPGWYDIVFPNPISCNFTLQVVEYQCNTPGYFDAQCQQFERLSEAIPVVTDVAAGETIIVASWVKNW